ncbi:dTDP-4-dehydrorhamnose reductase [Gammaproteobacteria bacterium]|nr:dTDP-4-dehydrorhamnose reductase [Gammaproteobacteria bacterium]
MKILVIGKNGQLGRSLNNIVCKRKDSKNFIFIGRKQLNLSNTKSIRSYFKKNTFNIIINCAAYTNVDQAEIKPNIAKKINHNAVLELSNAAKKQNCKLIHISTDYVFDGSNKNSYSEEDLTNPINIYGQSKLDGEKAIQNIMKFNAIIIRTSWVYSEFKNNFVDTMLRLGKNNDELNVVSDQIGSPTYASDLALVILKIIERDEYISTEKKTEIFHFSNKGKVSWSDFAREIFKIAKIQCKVNNIDSGSYPTIAKRPLNSELNKNKIIKTFNMTIPSWRFSLKQAIKTKLS